MIAAIGVIVLPADLQIVKFADAPELTSSALHPQSDDEPVTINEVPRVPR